MGNFEDKIRGKFNQASFEMNPKHWDAFEKKWDTYQMSDLIYSQKLSNALSFSIVPYSPDHWGAMSHQLDQLDQVYERKVQSKFENASLGGAPMGWDKMEQRLNNQRTPLEEQLKSKLDGGTVAYRDQHWEDFISSKGKSKKGVFVGIALLLLGAVAAVYFVSGTDEQETLVQKQKAPETKQRIVDQQIGKVDFKEGQTPVVEFLGDQVKVEDQVVVAVAGKSRLRKNWSNRSKGSAKSIQQAMSVTAPIQNVKEEKEYWPIAPVVLSANDAVNPYRAQPRPLNKQDDQFELYKGKSIKEHQLPLGLSPLLNFWENAALTGVYGKHRVSCMMYQEFKVYSQYGKPMGTALSQPFRNILAYEYRTKGPWSFGVYAWEDYQKNRKIGELSVSSAFTKNWGKQQLRIGASVDIERDRLSNEDLQFIDLEAGVDGGQFHLQTVRDLDYSVQNYASVNFGVSLISDRYFLTYGLKNAANVKINYAGEFNRAHQLMVGSKLLYDGFTVTPLVKLEYEKEFKFSPGISISRHNRWFSMLEFEDVKRASVYLGYQYRNGLRLYGGVGTVYEREEASVFRDIFAQRSHVQFGITYIVE